jgi:hypothetical protein
VRARSPVVCFRRRLRESGPPSLPIAAVVGSSALPIVGVLALSLPIASVLRSLLVPVRPLPTAVISGQMLRVLLLPAPHERPAVGRAAVLPRACAAELRSRLLLPALRAALQVHPKQAWTNQSRCLGESLATPAECAQCEVMLLT